MGLLDLLTTQGSPLSYNGAPPPPSPYNSPQSTLHYQSSINNNPNLGPNLPPASQLDLNAQIPTISTNPGSTQLLPYTAHQPG
jgi:hypothetical protein